MTDRSADYALERYDHTWGGWKPVAKAWDDDSPATFTTKPKAVAAMRVLASRSPIGTSLRVRWKGQTVKQTTVRTHIGSEAP